jgi:hypothetical protein
MTLIIDPPLTRRRVARPDPHRGPKARLERFVKPDTTLRRVGREPRILLKLAPLLMLPFAGASSPSVCQG